MKIYFETWIHEQNISDDALLLFDESIKCYRVGAYRASFLMSYLGFMKILKERLLRSDCPVLINPDKWNELKRHLDDDNKWESDVLKTTQARDGAQNRYYLINDDIMDDIKYWKRKRNECAHAKDTIIGYSHVDAFWLFLQSNLSKFAVNGGKEGLLARIDKYLNPIYTNPDIDPSYLIQDLPLVVKPSEIPELLKEIYNNHISLDTESEKQSYNFWSKVVYSSDSSVYNAFLDFVKFDENIFGDFITSFPDKLIEFKEEHELVRFLWKKRLMSKLYIDSEKFWELVHTLLIHKIIPDIELKKFVTKLAGFINWFNMPNADQVRVLKKNGVFEVIKTKIFDSGVLNKRGGYNLANAESYKIMFYLRNESLDVVVVRELNELFKTFEFGSFYTFMEDHIQQDSDFISEFRRIAGENDITLTEFFQENSEEIVS
ncbi:hypothetical protein CN544_28770 [Bacillus toyonensis]|uniref:hypothetical protein n=1 Tax=Bacillus toyonensis TaxID=155322 RepID=UPI000BEFA159|nr:hypothetical protein [Bacillus toyonensis]PEN76845.1 hypothetical protein CN544_28770 [Bacillus toyonensis]